MKKTIDCLFIGYNAMKFERYKKIIEKMGVNSGAYRDLNLNFIEYNNRTYTVPGVFNLFRCKDTSSTRFIEPLKVENILSPAITYLGSYLSGRGLTFDFVNSFQDEKAQLAQKLVKDDMLIIAVTTTFYTLVIPILEIIDFIKNYNPGAKIVVGGPFIATQVRSQDSRDLENLFKLMGADFYINSSQGETALVELIYSLKKGLAVEKVNNIYYKTNKGYQATTVSKENNQLAENMVMWDLFTPSIGEHVNIRTSASCPFSCAFCGFPQHAGNYQTVAVPLIEKELNSLHRLNTVKYVNFIDDTFNVPANRFKKILRMMVKNRYKFKWYSYFRCQFADGEMVELMKESGCVGVFMGLESGNNQILKNMNKTASVEKYLQGIELLKESGIITFGSFIVGFPGETYETLEDTVRFIEKSELDFYRAQLWYGEPITPIYRQRKEYDIKGERFEWSHATLNSRQGCDLIDEVFLTVDKSIWVPQYNFDFIIIWELMRRGWSLDRVKDFLRSFNSGIREKLSSPNYTEASWKIIKRIKKLCLGSDRGNESNDSDDGEEHTININPAEAMFYFE